MKLITKTQRWMCLPAAFAMALDTSLADVLLAVGHDGGKVLWPDLPEPMCRRGFHPQELIDVCLSRGFAVTRIELAPMITPIQRGKETLIYPWNMAWVRFYNYIMISCGVIEGIGHRCGHAVAYDHGRIFDPDGIEYAYSQDACVQRDFCTQHLWRIDKIGG